MISRCLNVALVWKTPQSPKKPVASQPLSDESASVHTQSTSASVAPLPLAATSAVALEKYKMPDLRASHIRRIAELKSRGAECLDVVREGGMPRT